MKQKLNILFEGWINIPHSYAIVLCFQLIALYKNYREEINFYLTECKYFGEKWKAQKLIYTEEYNKLLSDKNIFVPYNGQKIDLIYRITYPYNITISLNNINIPKCVFYTSEFSTLDENYFNIEYPKQVNNKLEYVKEYLKENDKIYMTSPSIWSSNGLKPILDSPTRNRIITHGVDTSVFYKDHTNRSQFRKQFNIKDDDILMVNIGSMTSNKGIIQILTILNHLVNKMNFTKYKLLLKGTEDLYQSKQMLQQYFSIINITQEEITNLNKYLLYTDQTVGYDEIRTIFNGCDVYFSPYLAEGFNLTVLEALACGLNVIVPKTGSTKEYVEDIYNNGGSEFIYYIDSTIINENGSKRLVNSYDVNKILQMIITNDFKSKDSSNMSKYIEKNYSWNKVSHLLMDYFKHILHSY